jgi:uncharacterized tellurite resistance protein B-like protein
MSAKGGLMMGPKKVGALPSRPSKANTILTYCVLLSSGKFLEIQVFFILDNRLRYRHDLDTALTRGMPAFNMTDEVFLFMFNLKSLLQKQESQIPEPPTVNAEERLRIATCVVLLEVAKSDDEFCSLEQATLSAILQKEFDISPEAVEALVEEAHAKRAQSIDLYEFTSQINEYYSREEKIRIVELTWKIVYADEELNRYEDHFVHKLTRLFRLQHEELIDAKLKVLDQLRSGSR